MWKEDYKLGQLSLDIELSTFCNARCPQCSRTDHRRNVNKVKWLPLINVSLSKFKKWFSLKDIELIKNFHFSGSYGDPGMCKDLYKIVCYIIDNSITTTISINTNGGMRDENFWWDLGAKGQERLRVIFDIDGINQEMHEFYRRGVKLSKVLNNMSAVLNTPAKVRTFTVLFKHNQDYLYDIHDMCKNLGVTDFDWVEGNNFKAPTFSFSDEDGNPLKLEQVTNNRPPIPSKEKVTADSERSSRRVRDYRFLPLIKQYSNINCHALERNNVKISASGVVSPCCHLSPSLENKAFYKNNNPVSSNITKSGRWGTQISPIIQEYIDTSNIYNLNNNNILDILSSKWYNKSLPESWNDLETSCFGCKKMCGKK